ncbi:MAG TPA: hypothetical protein VNF49_06000 [Candidatus Binataceae bacterium]|nr:hypothetical protein [Candidatus Binataceae bacterium]
MTAVTLIRRAMKRPEFLLMLAMCGCGFASAPLKDTPQIVATPQPGQLNVTTQPGQPIGDVLPVYVSVANGSDIPRSIVPSQIFALNDSGARVAPLPPGEAARQAGGSGELKAALTNGAVGGVAEGALGAGLGAIVGSVVNGFSGLTGAASGAIVGAALGGGAGIVNGVQSGASKADQQANQQLQALALQGGEVRHDFTQSGYVFFPKGSYHEVEFLLVNQETGDTEVMREPWR